MPTKLKNGDKFKILGENMVVTVDKMRESENLVEVTIRSSTSGTWTETWILGHVIAGFDHHKAYEMVEEPKAAAPLPLVVPAGSPASN